jgi:hypothetical protein
MLDKPHHPHGVMLWLQIFIAAFLLMFGVFMIVAGLDSSALPVLVVVALFFFALGGFTLLNMISFRSQHVTLREDGISFRLVPLNATFVFPWNLKTASLPWNAVRALDIKLRSLGGGQRVYVLRTSAGDFAFYWPQWPEAEQIGQEIVRRSGATTSTEDMEAPAVTSTSGSPARLSSQERFLRGCGTTMLVLSGILIILCIVGLFGAEDEKRWTFVKALFFLSFGLAAAQGLRRYRKIR